MLVERVEGFASPAQWLRAYSEINQFEEQLVDHGIVVVKLLASSAGRNSFAAFGNAAGCRSSSGS